MPNTLDDNLYQLVTLKPANPSAGAQLIITVPDTLRYSVLSVHYTLTTDSTAATRVNKIVGHDGTDRFSVTLHNATLSASLALNFLYTRGVFTVAGPGGTSDSQFGLIHELILNPGESLRTEIENIQVTDQISDAIVRVKQWIAA